jgi:hypothetical protein
MFCCYLVVQKVSGRMAGSHGPLLTVRLHNHPALNKSGKHQHRQRQTLVTRGQAHLHNLPSYWCQ